MEAANDVLRATKKLNLALDLRKPKKAPPGPREPLHVKYGPDVHYGVRREGPHFGIKVGRKNVHLYADRIYIQNEDGSGVDLPYLTPEQAREVIALLQEQKVQKVAKTCSPTLNFARPCKISALSQGFVCGYFWGKK